jgi:D-amino peptidase
MGKRSGTRIYVHTDMEGMAGLGDGKLIADRASEDFRRCAALFWREVDAVCRGFFAGGATEVLVLDSHGVRNLDPSRMDPRIRFESNAQQIWWGSLDETWDATCFIGAHAMAGTQGGFLEHTQGAEWYRYLVNGRETGELGQWAAVAGEFGVPMILVTGDEAACREARAFFDPIVTVPVKRALSRLQADCLPHDEACRRVEQGAREALPLIGRARPFTIPHPSLIRWEFCHCTEADVVEGLPGVRRVGPREVEKTVQHAGYAVLPQLLKCQRYSEC